MPHDDDFDFEPVRGLPEPPPEGEHILWQGAPDWISLTRQALAADWVAGYFVALAAWRGGVVGSAEGVLAGLSTASWYLALGAAAVIVLGAMGWAMARGTVYTLTSRRVVMRIGAALQITLNLPYRWMRSADLRLYRDGTGSIELAMEGPTRLSYLVMWPHVKPWTQGRGRPALRCIADPQAVAAILARAAAAHVADVTPSPELVAHPVAAE